MDKTKRGFTLIELLMVIAIITILATVVLVSLSTARARARDTRRRADLKTIQNAVEAFYLQKGDYKVTMKNAAAGTEGTGAQGANPDGIGYGWFDLKKSGGICNNSSYDTNSVLDGLVSWGFLSTTDIRDPSRQCTQTCAGGAGHCVQPTDRANYLLWEPADNSRYCIFGALEQINDANADGWDDAGVSATQGYLPPSYPTNYAIGNGCTP